MDTDHSKLDLTPARVCPWCGDPAALMCDGLVLAEDGSRAANSRTCNAPICSNCTNGTPITGIACSRGTHKGAGCKRCRSHESESNPQEHEPREVGAK